VTFLPGYDAWKLASPYDDQPEPQEAYRSYSLRELLEIGEDLRGDLAEELDAAEIIEVTPEQITGKRDAREIILCIRYHPAESEPPEERD
jgi:hypothetical protein